MYLQDLSNLIAKLNFGLNQLILATYKLDMLSQSHATQTSLRRHNLTAYPHQEGAWGKYYLMFTMQELPYIQ